MTACVSEPVSWLRLERYALGELDGAAAGAIRDHLAACPVCHACLARIEADDRALPPLPVSRAKPTRAFWSWPRLAWAGGLLAAAAALLLVLRPGRDARPVLGQSTPPGDRIKGGTDATIAIVRERAGAVTAEAATFEDGDRFEVRVTCAQLAPVWADVVVFQRAEVSFPLAPSRIPCGNDVTFPGAFRITPGPGGLEPATVCVAIDPAGTPDRVAIQAAGPGAPGLACRPLALAPPPLRAGLCDQLLPAKLRDRHFPSMTMLDEELPPQVAAAGCLLSDAKRPAHVHVLCQDEPGFAGLMDAVRASATKVTELSVGRAAFTADATLQLWDDDAPCLATLNGYTGDATALARALAASLTPAIGARIHALAQ